MTGTIPSELRDLASPRGLCLDGSSLTGCVPAGMELLLTADDSVFPSELGGLPFC